MYAKIVEVSTAKDFGELYLLVHFWRERADFDAGRPPLLINDFVMQIRPTSSQLVVTPEGHPITESGRVVDNPSAAEDPDDPFQRETIPVDVQAVIRQNIKKYIRRAVQQRIRGDHSSAPATSGSALYINGKLVRRAGAPILRRIQRDLSDPQGHLSRDDVKALRNATFEEAG